MRETKKMRRTPDISSTPLLVGSSDRREYRLTKLDNGIEVILVRVPEGQSSKSAVSVAVNAGSMHEPDKFGGLAHFVEHCVFLGNAKYPTRNSLDKLLSKYNGYSNAHTEMEYTAYYLEVNTEALTKAVDIFAAAFTSPSFDRDMCCAELEAVDSEFHEVVNSDDCRVEQMLCAVSDEGHKYKKFTWGNRASLLKHGEEALVEAAKTFFTSHYRSDRMKVCFVSSLSLDKMEKLAAKFSEVPLRDSVDTRLAALREVGFPVSKLPVALAVKPVSEVHQLILLFQLPEILSHYASKPADYIAHLVGHEAEGSLIAKLRDAKLAVDISAGVGSDGYSCNSGLALFEIKINLTEFGVTQHRRIVQEFVFPYIEELERVGVVESVYDELKHIGKVQFNYTAEDSTKEPIEAAEELAIQLLDHLNIDRRHILIHDYLYAGFDETLIRKFLAYIKPEKAIKILVSKNAPESNLVEPVFGIHYSVLHGDEAVDSSTMAETGPDFIIPPLPNAFIPSVFDKILARQGAELFVAPTEARIGSTERLYCFGEIRSQPSLKTDIRLRLNVASAGSATRESLVESFVRTHLRVAYITDLLEAKLYTPKLIGYGVSIAAVPPGKGNPCVGIEVCVNGFEEHILSVLRLILDNLNQAAVDADRLARIHEVLKRGIANEELHPATAQGLSVRKVFLAPLSFFRASEKTAALSSVDAKDSVCGSMNILSVDGIIVGSFSEATKVSTEDLIRKLVSHNPTSSLPENQVQAVTTIASQQVISERTLNPNEPTSCLLMYYQIASEFSVQKSAVADVLADLMAEPFFDCLRTEEQLGYSVQCGARYTNGSIGIEFSIQSSGESPEAMVAKVENFINEFYEREIEVLTDEEFDDQIESLIEGLTEPPTSLAREARDIWSEVTEGRLCWNFNELIKAEIEREYLGKRKMIKSLITSTLRPDCRVIVQINGTGKLPTLALEQ